MDRWIYYNGRVVEPGSVTIPATSAGLIYGWGVFTTVRIYGGVPFALDHHWERLAVHCDKIKIRLTISREEFDDAIESLIKASSRMGGRLRINVFRGRAGIWRTGIEEESDVLILTADEPQAPAEDVSITISPYRVLSNALLAGVKQTAMLEHLLAFDEARARGFNEAIMLNERGEITSATAANIFWVEGDEIFTPSLATGCVAGVTRRIVHELAAKWNLHVVEGSFPVTRLLAAREVFLTSTAREISIVRSFDAKEYSIRQARIAKLLARRYRELTRSSRSDVD